MWKPEWLKVYKNKMIPLSKQELAKMILGQLYEDQAANCMKLSFDQSNYHYLFLWGNNSIAGNDNIYLRQLEPRKWILNNFFIDRFFSCVIAQSTSALINGCWLILHINICGGIEKNNLLIAILEQQIRCLNTLMDICTTW